MGENLYLALHFTKLTSVHPYRKCKRKPRSLLCMNRIKPAELNELLLTQQYLCCTGNLGFVWRTLLLSGISVALAGGKILLAVWLLGF